MALDPIGTLFLDVSHTVAYGFKTGVQRVVRRVVTELEAVDPRRAVPVVAIDGRFHALTVAGRIRFTHPTGEPAAFARPPWWRRLAIAALQLTPAYERSQEHSARNRADKLLKPWADARPIDVAPGDAVVLIDAFWGGTSALPAAERLQKRGTRLIVVVYDMIPFTHPRFMPSAIVKTFVPRMRRALRSADGAVAISRHCAAEVLRFMGSEAPPVDHFYLGSDFADSGDTGVQRDGTRIAYLMVGTVEPRKGHGLVLDTFEQRWAAGEDVTLTFVGRFGWADPSLVARCRDHPERGRRFTMLDDADDATLAARLAESDATIIASSVEGFGLPLVESLARGVPVIASDIPVLREVGGSSALYFNLADPEALVEAMQAFECESDRYRAIARSFVWLDWRASAEQFRIALTNVLAKQRG